MQTFDTAMLDAVDSVASTSYGDDCGETLVASSWTRSKFAQGSHPLATYLGPQFVAPLSPSASSTEPKL